MPDTILHVRTFSVVINDKKNYKAMHDIITDHIYVTFIQCIPIPEANSIIKEMKSKKRNYLENMSTRRYKSINFM